MASQQLFRNRDSGCAAAFSVISVANLIKGNTRNQSTEVGKRGKSAVVPTNLDMSIYAQESD